MRGSAEVVEAEAGNNNGINPEVIEEQPTALEQNSVECSAERKNSLRARYSYGIIFLLTNLSAWFIRDYGRKVFPQLRHLESCGTKGRDCFHTMGVLRVSLGCFIFFLIMFLTTCKTSKLDEGCNAWHCRWWKMKFILLIASLAAPFLFPSGFIHLYGELARVGAGIFLVLQLISVIEFITWWNNCWMPDEKRTQRYVHIHGLTTNMQGKERMRPQNSILMSSAKVLKYNNNSIAMKLIVVVCSCFLGLFMSTLFYVASMCGIVLMYSLYAPRTSCCLNIFFITWTAILLLVMMVIALHSKVNRGLLSSGIMASYVVFLCWSAIRSEPATENCISQKQEKSNGDWTTVMSFLIGICAIVMATFSTGIDSQSFQFRKDKVEEEDDIPYKYGFFHMIFSLGAMYFAMLLISWNLDSSARKWSIDTGWASTWVKIVNEWLAATIYLWKLISPVVRQGKVMDIDEGTTQQMHNSA